MLFTTVIGSYPQPDWLIDRARLAGHLPPRVPAGDLWRVPLSFLAQAQDDATVLAVRDMERAGIDIVTDGETRRESWSNHFVGALAGLDLAQPAAIENARGDRFLAPRIVGPIRRTRACGTLGVGFLRAATDRTIKASVPGPISLASYAKDEFYGDPRSVALAFADAVRGEILDLYDAGADVVQLDEPTLQSRPEAARAYGLEAIDRAVADVPRTVALHMCFGYGHFVASKPNRYAFLGELETSPVREIAIEAAQPDLDVATLDELATKTITLGVLDLSTTEVESPDTVARRIRRALRHCPPERLQVAPDCGMKYLPRSVAFAKLRSLVQGRDIVRAELR